MKDAHLVAIGCLPGCQAKVVFLVVFWSIVCLWFRQIVVKVYSHFSRAVIFVTLVLVEHSLFSLVAYDGRKFVDLSHVDAGLLLVYCHLGYLFLVSICKQRAEPRQTEASVEALSSCLVIVRIVGYPTHDNMQTSVDCCTN